MELKKIHNTGVGVDVRFRLTESADEVYAYANEGPDSFTEIRDSYYTKDESGAWTLKSEKIAVQWITAINGAKTVAFVAVRRGEAIAFHLEPEYFGLGIRQAIKSVFDDLVAEDALSCGISPLK